MTAPRWHLIEGQAGCEYALGHRAVAVVVDALRASATAAMLLHAGATEILAVREVADAFEARRAWPDALLYGERGGLPPEGFDYGNSPMRVEPAHGRRVIFTTTTGAGRLVAAWSAAGVCMGSTVNATAVARAGLRLGHDVVVIPAGLAGDPHWDAQEDWVAAATIVRAAQDAAPGGFSLGEGGGRFRDWCERIDGEGVARLFETAPHAEKLRRVGLGAEVPYCAQLDLTDAVPWAVGPEGNGILLRSRA